MGRRERPPNPDRRTGAGAGTRHRGRRCRVAWALLRRPDGLGARLLRTWLGSLSQQLERLNTSVVRLREHLEP